jgi:hypothetical protein
MSNSATWRKKNKPTRVRRRRWYLFQLFYNLCFIWYCVRGIFCLLLKVNWADGREPTRRSRSAGYRTERRRPGHQGLCPSISLSPWYGLPSLSSSARFQRLALTWEGFIRVFWELRLLDFFREIWAATHWPHLVQGIHPFHVDKKVLAPWYGPCAQIAPENFLFFPQQFGMFI